MRATSLLRNHPVALFGLAVAGLVAWVAADAPDPPPWALPADAPGSVPPGPWALTGARPADLTPRPTPDPGAVDPSLFDRLLPGMTRREVEILLGVPSADRVAAISPDRLTYRTTYPVFPPPTDGPYPLVALEYDASRTGHPLLKVHRPATF
ncbi:MAG: outer membrane protein assembly factor BamE [Gemmataceae bacterium]|nr:outer membrane protein assembly factor BamE [Gemmataceae bacterium]